MYLFMQCGLYLNKLRFNITCIDFYYKIDFSPKNIIKKHKSYYCIRNKTTVPYLFYCFGMSFTVTWDAGVGAAPGL